MIGGGVVGCAVASRLAGLGFTTVLLEREEALARGTTSRNSGVAHGGMYYPAGTLKARLCVEGRRMMKEFCTENGVRYHECGKLIVAVETEEEGELQKLLDLGRANEVEDLDLLTRSQLQRMEPEVQALAGLHSPRTAVIDPEEVANAYARHAATLGAQVLTGAEVAGLEPGPGSWQVQVQGVGSARKEGWTHQSRVVVNAAGLWSDRVATLAGVDVSKRDWGLRLAKGNYFSLASGHRGRIGRLVYPVPPAGGTTLGVHVCLDLDGRMKLGPDLEPWTRDPRGAELGSSLDFTVDAGLRKAFFEGARRFLPWLKEEDLEPDMSGYRPRLPRDGFNDFVIHPETGQQAGMIHLVGIDSPGLTSSPAIAAEVGRMAREVLG